jgi:hypothetical protein
MDGMLYQATPEQVRIASARLMARGIQPTRVNIAEEIAVMNLQSQAAPPVVPGAGRVGPQPSQGMLDRIKAEQDARNRALFEKRRNMSGAR